MWQNEKIFTGSEYEIEAVYTRLILTSSKNTSQISLMDKTYSMRKWYFYVGIRKDSSYETLSTVKDKQDLSFTDNLVFYIIENIRRELKEANKTQNEAREFNSRDCFFSRSKAKNTTRNIFYFSRMHIFLVYGIIIFQTIFA